MIDATWLELLAGGDVEACLGLLRALGGRLDAPVSLIEGALSPEEALSYAAILCELGQRSAALEVTREVASAALGWTPVAPRPLGAARSALA